MLGLITAALGLLKTLLGMKSDSDANKAGQDAQARADDEANLALIRKANIAAKEEETSNAPDPNDRAGRK